MFLTDARGNIIISPCLKYFQMIKGMIVAS